MLKLNTDAKVTFNTKKTKFIKINIVTESTASQAQMKVVNACLTNGSAILIPPHRYNSKKCNLKKCYTAPSNSLKNATTLNLDRFGLG
jgi:hypothetical protein